MLTSCLGNISNIIRLGGGGIETLSHQPLSSIDSLLSLLSRNFVLLDCWEIIGSSRLKTVVDYGSSRMKTVGKL